MSMCPLNSSGWQGGGEGGCQISIIHFGFLLSNIQFFCRYNLQVLYWRNLDQESDVSWWKGDVGGATGGEVLRQELCAQERKGQVAAHNLRADKVNYSGVGRTDKKCRFYILNYRIAGDGARSEYLQQWIKKLKAALIRIHPCIHQSLVLLIAGARITCSQFISPSVLWLLWLSAAPGFLSKLCSVPRKGHRELWLRREEQPVVAPLSQALPQPCSGDADTWVVFPCARVSSLWVQTKPWSQITH